MEGLNLCCDIYHRDVKTARLEIVDGKLKKYEVYTDNRMKTLFPEGTTETNIKAILQGRVICPQRCDEGMLASMGLKEYNAYDILRATHAVNDDDFIWMKFDGEDISWKDVRVRV